MGNDVTQMEGLTLSPLKIIPNAKGDILHAMKKSDTGFRGFGEAYFSFVKQNETKGWKKHRQMTLNLVVPVGEIRFYVHDDRPGSPTQHQTLAVSLSQTNYQRLTLSPGLWLAFKGISEQNMLMNFADLEHDPGEAENKELNAFSLE